MSPNSHELDKQRIFDSFSKKVLRNEIQDYRYEIMRLSNKEVFFSELSAKKLEKLSITDEYFVTSQVFSVLDYDITVNDEDIATVLSNLPKHKRDIILLFYFLNLSDKEVGEKLNLIRSTVQYQRSNILQELKKMMKEGSAYDQTDNDQ